MSKIVIKLLVRTTAGSTDGTLWKGKRGIGVLLRTEPPLKCQWAKLPSSQVPAYVLKNDIFKGVTMRIQSGRKEKWGHLKARVTPTDV